MLVSYEYGRLAVENMALLNECTRGPEPSLKIGGGVPAKGICLDAEKGLTDCAPSVAATTCETWSGCSGDVEVVFCTVPAEDAVGGHILFENHTGLVMSALTWEFFSRF